MNGAIAACIDYGQRGPALADLHAEARINLGIDQASPGSAANGDWRTERRVNAIKNASSSLSVPATHAYSIRSSAASSWDRWPLLPTPTNRDACP